MDSNATLKGDCLHYEHIEQLRDYQEEGGVKLTFLLSFHMGMGKGDNAGHRNRYFLTFPAGF